MLEQKRYQNLSHCPVKVIFLDTHIISNMAKWKMGKKLDEVILDRIRTLYDYIYRLVRAKKLICPEIRTFQEEYRLNTRIEETCEKIVVDLSRGIKFRSRQLVEDFQIQLAMKAYIQNSGAVDYAKEWFNMYAGDPIKQLMYDSNYIFRFDWSKRLEDNEKIRERKKALRKRLEKIKIQDANRTPTFEEKLAEEYKGYLRGILSIPNVHLGYWERIGGKPEGVKGLLQFYRSEYLRSVPSIEIQAKLWAGFAVYQKSAKPKEGDANDIAILATVLPYADFIILDKTIADLTRSKLHLDNKYNTKIFNSSEIDQLALELEQIEKSENPLCNLVA